jgi:hypothetical protein
MKSIIRPGVPIIKLAHCCNFSICLPIARPPVRVAVLTHIEPKESLKNSSSVCVANSRVGDNTITCGLRTLGSTQFTNGIANAAVLPVPV